MKFKFSNKTRFTCQQSRVPTKIHILSCAHIWFKINMSVIQTVVDHQRPPEGAPQFGNLYGKFKYLIHHVFRKTVSYEI
jgi:hypothetical protein